MFLQYVGQYTSSLLFLTLLVLILLLVSKIGYFIGPVNNFEDYWTLSFLQAEALDPIRSWLSIPKGHSSIHFWNTCELCSYQENGDGVCFLND